MDNLPVNPADLAVFAVIGLSALLAFARGFVREVLSVASWVGAAFAAMYAYPHVQPLARQYISFHMLADGVAVVGVFVAALALLSLFGAKIANVVQGSTLNAIDRSLGVLFGVARGAALVSLAYLFVVWLLPPNPNEPQPAWLAGARTRPMAEAGAEWLKTLVPADTLATAAGEAGNARDQAQRALAAEEALRKLATPVPRADVPTKTGAPAPDQGYNNQERGNLERLIQNQR